jgi:hypothetical protein
MYLKKWPNSAYVVAKLLPPEEVTDAIVIVVGIY